MANIVPKSAWNGTSRKKGQYLADVFSVGVLASALTLSTCAHCASWVRRQSATRVSLSWCQRSTTPSCVGVADAMRQNAL